VSQIPKGNGSTLPLLHFERERKGQKVKLILGPSAGLLVLGILALLTGHELLGAGSIAASGLIGWLLRTLLTLNK
jgi:hypothetical protein